MAAGSSSPTPSDKIPGQRGAWMRLRFNAEPVAESTETETRKRAGER